MDNEMSNTTPTHAIDIEALGRAHDKINLATAETCLEVKNLSLYYSEKQALFDINLKIPKRKVTAFIGPSGCGKSTLLRCMNRMNDLVDGTRIDGQLLLENDDIYDKSVDAAELRRRVGMVFQKPNPFPKSIYENVAYGLRLQGVNDRRMLDEVVEGALKRAALWKKCVTVCTITPWVFPVGNNNV
jgi:phosphate transport system ATP-binding protein